ncbi:MAG: hypothetical protein HXY36_06125 [Chloroflexi bacterium]|nr:hypothetical protein [Chloroflexota bacterium]
MHQDDVELLVPGRGYHLLELRPFIRPGALTSINKFLHYLPTFALGMIAAAL